MRNFLPLVVSVVVSIGICASAQADDAGDIRQQLASLSAQIERLDTELATIGQQRTDIQSAVTAFAHDVEDNKAAAQRLKELNEHLTTSKEQLTAEQKTATELCSKKVSEKEYKALLQHCESARSAYQKNFDEAQAEYQKVVDEHAKYDESAKHLESERKALATKQENVQQQQSALHDERERAAKQFNEMRERLIALQSKPDLK